MPRTRSFPQGISALHCVKTFGLCLALTVSLSTLPADANPTNSLPNVANPSISGKKLPSPAELSGGALKVRLQNDHWFLDGRLSGSAWRSTNPHVLRGDAYAEQMKLGAAEQEYQAALQANPNDAGAHAGLGKLLLLHTTSSNGNIRKNIEIYHQEGIQQLLTALRLQPNSVEANLTLAQTYWESGNRQEDAREYAANAYQLAPHRSDVLTQVGHMLLDEGRGEEALPLLSEATHVDAHNANAYTYLGKTYAALGQTQKALDALNTALWLQPNNAPLHDALATIYQHQGNEAAAASHWQQALTIKPEYTPASIGLAGLYADRQDWPLALGVLKNGYHSILPTNGSQKEGMALAIGKIALENRQPKVAEQYFNDVLEADPNHWEARQGLSKAQLQEAQLALVDAQAYGGDILTREQSLATLQQALQTDRTNVKAKLVQTKVRGSARNLSEIPANESQAVIDDLSYSVTDSLAQGEIWTARFDPLRAERSFSSAIQSPAKPEDQIRVGDILLTLGQPEFARQAFNRAAQSPDPLLQKAAQQGLKLAAAQEAQALQAFRYAQQTRAQAAKPAEQWLNEALLANQRLAEAHYLLAEHYEHQKDPTPESRNQAVRHFHAFVALSPTHPQVATAERHIYRLVAEGLKAEARLERRPNRS